MGLRSRQWSGLHWRRLAWVLRQWACWRCTGQAHPSVRDSLLDTLLPAACLTLARLYGCWYMGSAPANHRAENLGTPLVVVCVGTFTVAGDPIEVGAATSVLQPRRASGQTHNLLLSAFKSEGGHAEPAAGVLGLLRLAAQVRYTRHSVSTPHKSSRRFMGLAALVSRCSSTSCVHCV